MSPRTEKPTTPPRPPDRGPPLEFALHVALDVLGAGNTLGTLLGSSVSGSLSIERRGWLAPELRLGFSYAGTDSPPVERFEYARFTWWRGFVEACPFRFLPARTVEVRPCAAGRIGALVSEGHGIQSSLTSTHPWGELGATLLVEWRLVGPMAIEVEGGAEFPLSRQEFDFQRPLESAYATPPVMGEVTLGLGVHFP